MVFCYPYFQVHFLLEDYKLLTYLLKVFTSVPVIGNGTEVYKVSPNYGVIDCVALF